MVLPRRDKVKYQNKLFSYATFDSVLAFNDFVDAENQRLSRGNNDCFQEVMQHTRMHLSTDWYGTPSPESILELENHKEFLGMHLLAEVEAKIREHLSRYLDFLESNVLPKPKLAYNDKSLGIFCFDRAAIGLHKVNAVMLQTSIEKEISKLSIELGKSRVQTHVKNVFAFFQNRHSSNPSLRLYILAGANAGVKGNDLLYIGVACIELAAFLEARNIPVEVNVILGSEYNDHTTLAIIRVKRFEDSLDCNQLLLMSSDPRYFRYRGFKAMISLANYFDRVIPEDLGSIQPNMATDFIKAVGEDGFVFEQSYSIDSATKEVIRIINNYVNRTRNGKDVNR